MTAIDGEVIEELVGHRVMSERACSYERSHRRKRNEELQIRRLREFVQNPRADGLRTYDSGRDVWGQFLNRRMVKYSCRVDVALQLISVEALEDRAHLLFVRDIRCDNPHLRAQILQVMHCLHASTSLRIVGRFSRYS